MKNTNDNKKGLSRGLSRAHLARESGVGVETVRYYERRGLIDPPTRAEHTHPVYSELALEQMKYVKRAQDAGFTLKEITTLNSLGSDHCSVTKSLAEEKLEKIRLQISGLEGTAVRLQAMVEQCDASNQQGTCALFETLHDKKA